MTPSPSPASRLRPSGLFTRILVTFVATVLGATVVGALGTLWMTRQLGDAWVGEAIEILGERNDELYALLDQPEALSAKVEGLEQELGTRVTIYDIQGFRLAGRGRHRAPALNRRFRAVLGHGRPVVRRPRGVVRPPMVLYPITHPDGGFPEAVVHVASGRPSVAIPFLVSGGVIVGLLAVGAWFLSRSFTRRLAVVERSAERIARGELEHRVPLPKRPPRDEIDDLAVAFNEMADKVQHLVRGQQTLLANVSHELRTPISRVKVLLELLQDRLDKLETARGTTDETHLERLRSGLADMEADTNEIEKLIADLLTSGKLELGRGEAGLQVAVMDLAGLVRQIAARYQATVDAPDELETHGDELLLQRLLSNLLSNARRACPDDAVEVTVRDDGDHLTVAVEDRGPGIPPAEREHVFEAFARLDDARSRDRGGVGLGLYLSRQIARAHGGEVRALDRSDGASGARLEVTLPKHDAAA